MNTDPTCPLFTRQERTAQYGGRMFVFATTQGVQGDMPSAIAQAL